MKKTLFFLTFICAATLSAQTITWTGAINTNWDNIGNWSTSAIPTAANDVIIPTGKTVVVNIAGVTKSIVVQGNAVVTIAGGLSFLNASSIAANAVTTWTGGFMNGGGTLTNAGTLNLALGNPKVISEATTITNTGTINIQGGGLLYINDGTINNQVAGTIDLMSDNGNITWSGLGSHLVNNLGILKRSSTSGTVYVSAELHNSGIVTVMQGTLSFNDPTIVLTGGAYNVSAGATLEWRSSIACSGVMAGALNGELNWNGTLNVVSSAAFNFTGAGFDWAGGTLVGGGTVTNNSSLNLITGSPKVMGDGLTFNNNATLNIMDGGLLYLNDATFNNPAAGTINMKSDGGAIVWSGSGAHLINNAGNITKNTSAGNTGITASLKNTGTVAVTNGTLSLNDPNTELTNGVYNVSLGATLQWDNTVTCSGTLAGAVDGTLNMTNTVSIPVSAVFNFTGNGAVNWSAGVFSGPGILGLSSKLNLATSSPKVMGSGLTLNNNSLINILDGGLFYVNDGILNNLAAGVIDMKSDNGNITWSGSGSHLFNNFGLLKKSTTNGAASMQLTTLNSGIIDAQSGNLVFYSGTTFTNNISGIVMGTATITPPPAANFINNGTFAPGGSPGQLSVVGDFTSTNLSKFAVELNGPTQTTQYDHMAIQGNADFNGTVEVTLGFNANLNDIFTIATTTGTITTFGMATTTSANYSGTNYTFTVSVTPDNKNLILTVTQKVLANDRFDFTDQQVTLFPNPAENFINLKNPGSPLTGAQITDLNGRIIRVISEENVNQQIDLDGFASGIYLMKINSGDAVTVKRFIVK